MVAPKILANLDDGPRAGETVEVSPRPDGTPPEQIEVSDPLGEPALPGTIEPDGERRSATTYHLHEAAGPDDAPVYRTGHPD